MRLSTIEEKIAKPKEIAEKVNPKTAKLTTLAGAECYLCIQHHEESLKEIIVLYTCGKGKDIKKIAGPSTEGQTYLFKNFSPKDLRERAVKYLNAILKDRPLDSKELSTNIFRDRYLSSTNKKAEAYEEFRDFHIALNK